VPKRPNRSWFLSALACWLTLLASADDFNLARLALPPSAADAGESLPLDDPNSDFTQPSQSREPKATPRDRCGCTSSAGPRLAGAALTSSFAAPAHGHRPQLCLNSPLRC
jgi:hypothetical protein